jgi:hypothetical protein
LAPATLETLRQRYPWAELVPAPPEATVFARRALGLARARGEVAVLLEDHCAVAPGWRDALLAPVAAGHALAGGPVESARPTSVRGWALYLVEYAGLLPPVSDARAVLAVNAAYDRAALESCRAVWADGFHEAEVHEALAAAGHRPRLSPGAVVHSSLDIPLRHAAAHLFRGGARFGAHRARRFGAGERALRILAAPLVPVVLMARIAGRVLRRRPRAATMTLLALPRACALVLAWSAGELAGHLPRRAEAR